MNGKRDDENNESRAPDTPDPGTGRRGLTDKPDEPNPPPGRVPDRKPGDDGFIRYEVNGERQRTEEQPLTVERILRKAGAAAGLDVADIGNYYLERVSDGTEYRNLSDSVTIEDGDRFLAVYAGKTPVAGAADEVTRELEGLGFAADVLHIPGLGGDQAAVFDYQVDTGRHKGRTFRVGVSFQEAAYPEYPPHFVWVAGLQSPALPAHSNGRHDGVEWCAFSVPPSDFWDRLPAVDKNMKTYMARHMRRFWNQM